MFFLLCVFFFLFLKEKHSKICQKSATKRRKVFDSSRQRAEGTDIPTLKPIKPKVRLHLRAEGNPTQKIPRGLKHLKVVHLSLETLSDEFKLDLTCSKRCHYTFFNILQFIFIYSHDKRPLYLKPEVIHSFICPL